jgi:hypothetical protein
MHGPVAKPNSTSVPIRRPMPGIWIMLVAGAEFSKPISAAAPANLSLPTPRFDHRSVFEADQ